MPQVKRSSLILFFVLAYLFSWLVWGAQIAEATGRIAFHVPGAFAFIGLSLAAVIAALVAGGLPALRDLLGRWLRWRAHPVWYVVALVLTALLGLVAIGLARLFGQIAAMGTEATLSATLVYFATHWALFLVTEETAWRGFALPRLQNGSSALQASLILGLLWGLWHTPLFFMPGSFQSTIPFVGFLISAIATAILHTWIFNYTSGSVLIAALFHAATDASIVYLGVMSQGSLLFWLFVAVQVAAAAAVVAVEGAARLSRKRDQSGTVVAP